jgi:hypothetical protein
VFFSNIRGLGETQVPRRHRALKDNRAQLQAIVNDLAPGLTNRRGIGPVTAAQTIVSFSHPGRCRNDAAFAALAGAASLRPAAAAPGEDQQGLRGPDLLVAAALSSAQRPRPWWFRAPLPGYDEQRCRRWDPEAEPTFQLVGQGRRPGLATRTPNPVAARAGALPRNSRAQCGGVRNCWAGCRPRRR